LVMALVDVYPGMPGLPTLPALRPALDTVALAGAVSVVCLVLLSRLLPQTGTYRQLVSQGTSGTVADNRLQATQQEQLGAVGIVLTPLHPGGKAKFGEEILDVMSEGDLIEPGRTVRVIGHRGFQAVVAAA